MASLFRSHRCTSTGHALLLVRCHVACVSKHSQNKKIRSTAEGRSLQTRMPEDPGSLRRRIFSLLFGIADVYVLEQPFTSAFRPSLVEASAWFLSCAFWICLHVARVFDVTQRLARFVWHAPPPWTDSSFLFVCSTSVFCSFTKCLSLQVESQLLVIQCSLSQPYLSQKKRLFGKCLSCCPPLFFFLDVSSQKEGQRDGRTDRQTGT